MICGLPLSRIPAGEYGETHSASRLYDFQCRRLNLRYRDVDEAGYIVASGYDPFASERSTRVNRQDLAVVMRAIRSQKGDAAETDDDGGSE